MDATDSSGPSGRVILEALIDGAHDAAHDPAVIADLARVRLRNKIPALGEAPSGRFAEHHAFLTRLHLNRTDQHHLRYR